MYILFDADGTFLEGKYLDLTPFGIEREKLEPFFRDAFPKCRDGSHDLKEVVVPYLESRWREGTVDDLLEYRFSSQKTIRPGMMEFLEEMKSLWHSCYLCTQQEKHRARYMREDMSFDQIFDECFITSEVWYAKNDPKFFESIIETLSVDSSDVILIDDSEWPLSVAKDIWLQTCHFTGDMDALRSFFS